MAQVESLNLGPGSDLLKKAEDPTQEQAILSKGPGAMEIPSSKATEKTDAFVAQSVNNSESSVETSKATSSNGRKRSPPEPLDSAPSSKKSKGSPSPPASKDGDTSKPIFPSPPDVPATTFDKETWQGFCEIESEPACFSVILREMGVKDVTVREVFSMDQYFIRENIPQPIYGFILLFHYREFGSNDQEHEDSKKVWFANQLPAQNSCATLAMINILMNQGSDVNIGEHLEQFKDFTSDFTPYQRGEAFASFDFIKRIHNSFAKKMDILEGDKHLSHKVKRAERAKAQSNEKTKPKKRGTKSSRRASVDSIATEDSEETVENNAHHYIAFIPVGNEVWKLDGFDKNPTCMGSFDPSRGESWLESVSTTIATLMAAGDDDYGVIALTQSPLVSLRNNISLTLNTLTHVESRLSSISPNWGDFTSADDLPPSPSMLGLDPHYLSANPVPSSLIESINEEQDTQKLLTRRNQLMTEAHSTGSTIVLEMQSEAEENVKASQRRYDSGPVIKKWLEMLAENGWLEQNLERYMPGKANGSGGGRKK